MKRRPLSVRVVLSLLRYSLITTAAAAALLLLPAVLFMWVRSHYVYDHVSRTTADGGAYVVRSSEGSLYFDRRSRWDTTRGLNWLRSPLRPGYSGAGAWYDAGAGRQVELLGFGVYGGTQHVWPGHLHGLTRPLPPKSDPRWWRDSYGAVAVPYWFLAAMGLLLPRRWLAVTRRWKHRRRMAMGLCPACTYNLTGNRSGTCPECGMPASLTEAS